MIGLMGLSRRSLHDKLIEQVSANIYVSRVYFSFKFSCPQALLLIIPVPSLAICLNPLVLQKSQSLGHGLAQQSLLCGHLLTAVDGEMKKCLHAMTLFCVFCHEYFDLVL